MNYNKEHMERSCADLVGFALIFFCFVLTLVGVVINSAAVVVAGIVLSLLGLAYFRLMQN